MNDLIPDWAVNLVGDPNTLEHILGLVTAGIFFGGLSILLFLSGRKRGSRQAKQIVPPPTIGVLRNRKVLTHNASMRTKYTWLPIPYSTPTPNEEAAKEDRIRGPEWNFGMMAPSFGRAQADFFHSQDKRVMLKGRWIGKRWAAEQTEKMRKLKKAYVKYEPIGTKPVVGDRVEKIAGPELSYKVGEVFTIKNTKQGNVLPGFVLGVGPGITESCFTEEDSCGHAFRILKRKPDLRDPLTNPVKNDIVESKDHLTQRQWIGPKYRLRYKVKKCDKFGRWAYQAVVNGYTWKHFCRGGLIIKRGDA